MKGFLFLGYLATVLGLLFYLEKGRHQKWGAALWAFLMLASGFGTFFWGKVIPKMFSSEGDMATGFAAYGAYLVFIFLTPCPVVLITCIMKRPKLQKTDA